MQQCNYHFYDFLYHSYYFYGEKYFGYIGYFNLEGNFNFRCDDSEYNAGKLIVFLTVYAILQQLLIYTATDKHCL